MASARSLILMALLAVVLVLNQEATAAYRKPPFNGSIFGKRGASADYEGATKALTALCEIAYDTCSAWFPPEN